jgi:hypothetical protein
VEDIVAGRVDPSVVALEELRPEAGARVLDVAYDQLRYQYLSGAVTEEQSRSLSRRILIARSRLPSRAPGEGPATPVEPEVRPDQGHASSLVGLGAGWRDDESYIDVRWRPAFHDLMDDGNGHLADMDVRLLDTRLRVYPESGRVRLQELTFFEVASLSPWSRISSPWAWSTGTGLRTRRVSDNGNLDDVLVWGTHIGAGLAWDPHAAVLAYALADARLEVGSRLEHNVGLGPAARLGLYLGPAESRLRGHLFGDVTYFAVGDTTTRVRAGGEVRISTSRNTALHFEASAHRSYGDDWVEAGLRLSLYF